MSIIQAIEDRRLQKLASSTAGSERYIGNIQKKADFAKQVLSNDFDLSKPLEAQRLYYEYKSKYTGKNTTVAPLASKRAQSFWTAVANAAEKADVSIESFISAQFTWFAKNFGTYPKFENIRTEAAIQRAQEAAGVKPKKVVARYQAGGNFAELMRTADTQVRTMCSAQKLSRVEFYKQLVLTGVISLPQQFLKADPAYAEAQKSINE